jgi:protein arginine kinase
MAYELRQRRGIPQRREVWAAETKMSLQSIKDFDQWLRRDTPESPVVVSSRARLARNLPGHPFAPRANPDQLQHVAETIRRVFGRLKTLAGYTCYAMDAIDAEDRCFLRESHLISSDLEKGGAERLVFVSPQKDVSVMVNEEDHLRISALAAGLALESAYARLEKIESELDGEMTLAFSEDFGYLTACPTNTGTGLRLSVMLHLPALAMTNQIEPTLSDLGSYGLVVRGAYGENSEHLGDLYQISNEVSLGKTEEQILEILKRIVAQVIEREMYARERLQRDWRSKLEDMVCRSVGLLGMARRIDTLEALQLLSRARLGIGQDWGVRLSHVELNRLFLEVQPAHLQRLRRVSGTPEERDVERAVLLRSIFGASSN